MRKAVTRTVNRMDRVKERARGGASNNQGTLARVQSFPGNRRKYTWMISIEWSQMIKGWCTSLSNLNIMQ